MSGDGEGTQERRDGACRVCANLFSTKEELSRHLADEHPDDSPGNLPR